MSRMNGKKTHTHTQIRPNAPSPTARKACSLEEKKVSDRSEVLAAKQRRTQGHVCSVDDPECCKSKYILNLDGRYRLNSMWTEVNRLRQEILPPQYSNLPLRRPSARSPPQQPCSDSRTVTDMARRSLIEMISTSEGKFRFMYRFARREI